ncbi:MAG: tetratricopeptide repeat protein [Bacteroidetes bacterium]|nr:tetratricopeptide repeat protein [Bacteroidota bacterium]
MKKSLRVILIFTMLVCKAYGQTDELKKYIDKGIELYDKGDYAGAIAEYEKALKIDSKSALANYEMASTYFAMEKYDKAIERVDVVIDENKDYVDQAYILKGSAQDLMGKSKDAIKTYKKGLKNFPQSHLLHYNLAYTYYNMKEYKDAEGELQEALKIKPSHASSHLLLGYIMRAQGSRVKSLLSFYNFLLLEPTGKRAKNAFAALDEQMKKGVTRESEKSTTIIISDSKGSDEFSAAELMLSLLEASKGLEKNEGKSEAQLFADKTKSFFSVLGEMKDKNKGFWWDYYVDFYYAMVNENKVEAFSYYVTQVKGDAEITDWLTKNKEQLDAFSKWYEGYERKK